MLRENLLATLLLLVTVTVWAQTTEPVTPSDDRGVDEDVESKDVESKDVATLIKDLDGNRFSVRQAATQALYKRGPSAIPALVDAAKHGERETGTRVLEILKRHYTSENEDAKAAATKALEEIAQSENATLAGKASAIINPQPMAPPAGVFPGQALPGQFRIQLGGLGAQRIQFRNVNGVKKVNVAENGRQITIAEDPAKGIEMEVIETVNGKKVTKKYTAKNADELKKNHPEGHKLYTKYAQGPAGIQIQGIQLQPGRMIPLNPAFPPQQIPLFAGRIESRKAIADRIEKATSQLEETAKLIRQLSQQPNADKQLQKALEQLEKVEQELKEARKKISP